MEYITIALKLIVGLSILNVWLLNRNNASQWRGGGGNTMQEEFENYGLSHQLMVAVGVLKCTLAAALLVSIVFLELELYAALGIAAMMTVAIIMHFKINDSLKKSLPAFVFLVLSLIIAFF